MPGFLIMFGNREVLGCDAGNNFRFALAFKTLDDANAAAIALSKAGVALENAKGDLLRAFPEGDLGIPRPAAEAAPDDLEHLGDRVPAVDPVLEERHRRD